MQHFASACECCVALCFPVVHRESYRALQVGKLEHAQKQHAKQHDIVQQSTNKGGWLRVATSVKNDATSTSIMLVIRVLLISLEESPAEFPNVELLQTLLHVCLTFRGLLEKKVMD